MNKESKINIENLKVFFFTDNMVRQDNRLKDISKLIFTDLSYFAFLAEGKCRASNKYFSKKYGKSNGTISKAISELEQYGYIERYLNEYKNRTIYVRRSKFVSANIIEEDETISADSLNQHTLLNMDQMEDLINNSL